MPSISVIVCAHNEERYIASCLHSLLAQTRRPDEILVVNNASVDRTGEVARAASRRSARSWSTSTRTAALR